jgi:hypothetical protein
MDILEMVKAVTVDVGTINITPEQLKQLELLVVCYMSAAQLEIENKELSKAVISGLDVKWGSLFTVTQK